MHFKRNAIFQFEHNPICTVCLLRRQPLYFMFAGFSDTRRWQQVSTRTLSSHFTPSEQINTSFVIQAFALNVVHNKKELIYICISSIILTQGSKKVNPFQTDLSIWKDWHCERLSVCICQTNNVRSWLIYSQILRPYVFLYLMLNKGCLI